MWGSLVLILLIGATAATSSGFQYAWEPGQEYKYVVRSHTFTALGQPNKLLNDQVSGVVMTAILTLQVASSDTLIGNIAKAQYAQVHEMLPEGIESLPDSKLNYQSLPLQGENFSILVKHDVIQLKIDPQTPTWEQNLLKSIVSQLQLDTLGENALTTQGTQISTEKSPFGLYNVLEQSIGGDCEVLYDIAPLSEGDQLNPELVPKLKLTQDNGNLMDIKKTKNYENCRDLKIQSVNIRKNTKILSRMSTSRSIISGSLKKFTILSSTATSNMLISLGKGSAFGTITTKSSIILREKRETRQELKVSSVRTLPDLTYSFECSTDPIGVSEERQDANLKLVTPSSKESLESMKYILRGLDDSSSSEELILKTDLQDRSSFNKQSLTKLDELPKIPLLFDVGCATMQLTDEQRVNKVRALIQDLIDDLKSIDGDFPATPSKYLYVVKLMRTLGVKSLNRLKQHLEEDDNVQSAEISFKFVKVTALKVFYNALAQVGTGPALLVIKQDIKENKLQDSEAARVISKLDTAVRLLTKEYIEAICDMMKDPKVTKEKAVLNRAVSLVCGKLLGKAAKTRSNKLLSDSDMRDLFSRYILIMDQKLLQALKDNDVAQAYAIVLSLGYTADPKILSVFEPYLEEVTEVRISKQLRKLMIMMLDEVIRYNPSSTRSVALKIYLNQQESPDIRCIAVNSYIMSNPSMLGLMLVTRNANMRSNKEVSSCVKKSLVNAAKDQPLFKASLKTKARIATKYLDSEVIQSQIQGILDIATDCLSSLMDRVISNIIGNTYNNVPSSLYFHMEPHYSQLDTHTTTFAYDVSDMGQLIEKFMSRIGQKKSLMNNQMISPIFTQILHELKLKPIETELEGFVYMKTTPGSFLYSFSDSILDKDLNKLEQIFLENRPYNLVRMDVYDEILSLPIETGMPFVFSKEIPMISLIHIVGQKQDSPGIHTRGKFNVLHSSEVQYKVGFAVPFEQQQYIAGIDTSMVVLAPLAFDVKAKEEDNERHVSVKLFPSQPLSAVNKLVSLSNTPYTSINDLLEFKPILRSTNTHPVLHVSKLRKDTIHLGMFRLTMETDSACMTIGDYLGDAPSVCNSNIALQTWSDLDPKQEVSVTVVFAKEDSDEILQEDSHPAQGDKDKIKLEKWFIVDTKPDSRKRRQQLIIQAKESIEFAFSQVADVSVRTPAYGDTPVRDYVLTVAIGSSYTDNNVRGYVYLNRQAENENVQLEGILSGIASVKSVTLESLKQVVQFAPEDKYLVNAEFKEQGKDEMTMKLTVVQSQSANLKKAIQNSQTVQVCLEALNGGQEIQSCKTAVALANTKDDLKWSAKYNSALAMLLKESKVIQNIITAQRPAYIPECKKIKTNTTDTINYKNKDKNFLEMEIKVPFNSEQMDLTLYTSETDIAVSAPKEYTQTLPHFFPSNIPSCFITKNRITTFDDESFPVLLGKCWHLIVSTSEQSPVPLPIIIIQEDESDNMHATVITPNARFHFRVIEGELVVLLGDHSKPLISSSRIATYKGHDLWIYSTFDFLRLVTDNNELEFIYHGKAVEVRVADRWHKRLIGLCGNFDNIMDNDSGNQGCKMDTQEEFVASFALLSKDCQGPALLNKQKADMSLATCKQHQTPQMNVISDREAGRKPTQNENRAHHIILKTQDNQESTFNVQYRTWYFFENDGAEICFSTVPVPQCVTFGSKPEVTEQREYQFHCARNTDRIIELKNKIDEGARPDFSQRSVSMSRSLTVPIRCSNIEHSTKYDYQM